MNKFILWCNDKLNMLFNKKKTYIVELISYLDDNGNITPIGVITQNEKLIDKFETITFSRKLAYKIGETVNMVKYDGKFDIRVYE